MLSRGATAKWLILAICCAVAAVSPHPALAATTKDITVKNKTLYRQTAVTVKNGKKRVPLMCVFPRGERFGLPAISTKLDSRRNRYTFKPLTSRSTPKLKPEYVTTCARTERACAPILRLTSSPLPALEGSSVSVALSLTSPPGCGVATSATIKTQPHMGNASLTGTNPAIVTAQLTPGMFGNDAVEIQALNSIGQSVSLFVPLSVTARSCPPTLALSAPASSGITAVENDSIELTYSVQQPPLCITAVQVSVSSAPQHGTVEVVDGRITYRPYMHYVGLDQFVLSGTNDRGETTNSTVNVTLRQRDCTPRLELSELTAATYENRPVNVSFRLTAPEKCTLDTTTSIASSPNHGFAEVSGSVITYSPDLHYVGSDSFSVRVVNSRGELSVDPLSINVISGASEFAGEETELGDYRENLTPNEVRHLLCKFALCGNPRLFQIGVTQGRSALVSALLNYDVSPATAAIRAEIQSQLGGRSTDSFAYQIGEDSSNDSFCSSTGKLWWPVAVQNYWLAQLRYDNPLREHIAIHLHQHMPINVWVNLNGGTGGGCSSQVNYKGYVDMMRVHALGRAPQTPDERPVTGSFKGLITDMLTDYQMGLYLSHIQPWLTPGPTGWNDWKVGVHTNNFARELMQIFTLGPTYALSPSATSPIPNYTEHDVEEVARSLAGHINPMSSDLSLEPTMKQTPWRITPNHMGRYLEWSPAYREVGTKTIFENSSQANVRKVGDLTPPDVIDSIFNHRGIVYVPLSMFGRSVYPGPSPALVQQLGDYFRSTNFSLPSLYNLMMNSSATFSSRGRYGCISSGTVHVLRLLNTLQLPIKQLTSVAAYPSATFGEMLDIMRFMGDVILETPSIFGYGECGDIDGLPGTPNYGQALLAPQRMLGRFNAPFRMIKYYLEGNEAWHFPVPQEGFSITTLLPPGISAPTAAQMIAHFEGLFGIVLTDAERAIVMNYLDPVGDPHRPRWNGSNSQLVQYRVANLVAIFANHPDVNVR